jgi:hypothetical protein
MSKQKSGIQQTRFHPDVDLKIYDDPKHQVYRDVWLHARAKFKDHRGKLITVDFTKPALSKVYPEDYPDSVGWWVYTELPDEVTARKKNYKNLGKAITKINRMADGRHPNDDGGRARRWWECIFNETNIFEG